MGYADLLKGLFPDSHNVDGEVYSVMIGAVGALFDAMDPVAINQVSRYSVTDATGLYLDEQGNDWGVPRRNGESDDAYRARILGELPLYVNGPTVAGMKAVVKPFTGTEPTIFEYGPDAFVMGESAIDEAGFCTEADLFTFECHVQNPGTVAYNHLDLENAVRKAKLARSTAIIYHAGADTSPAAEASDAVVTITQ